MRVYFTRVRIRVSRAISTRGCGPARLETLRSVVVDVVRPVRGRKPRLARGHRRARDRAERSRTRPIDMGVGDEDHEKSGEIVGSDGEGTRQSSRDLLALMSADAPKKSATGDDKGTRGSSAPAGSTRPPPDATDALRHRVCPRAWRGPRRRGRVSRPRRRLRAHRLVTRRVRLRRGCARRDRDRDRERERRGFPDAPTTPDPDAAPDAFSPADIPDPAVVAAAASGRVGPPPRGGGSRAHGWRRSARRRGHPRRVPQ